MSANSVPASENNSEPKMSDNVESIDNCEHVEEKTNNTENGSAEIQTGSVMQPSDSSKTTGGDQARGNRYDEKKSENSDITAVMESSLIDGEIVKGNNCLENRMLAASQGSLADTEGIRSVDEAELASLTLELNNDSIIIIELVEELLLKVSTDEISHGEIAKFLLQSLTQNRNVDLENSFLLGDLESVRNLIDNVFMALSDAVKVDFVQGIISVLKTSQYNVWVMSQTNALQAFLTCLSSSDGILTDLLIEAIQILTMFSIDVPSLKAILRSLKTKCDDEIRWNKNSIKLFGALRSLPFKTGPDDFFIFPGKGRSGIILSPMRSIPSAHGFSITMWFRMDPPNRQFFEKETPFLYCFHTSEGVGYMCHIVGSCLVLTYSKSKGKGIQYCVQYDLQPRTWYFVAIVHAYRRWGKSTVTCYIDGNLISEAFIPFRVETTDIFDRCCIGCAHHLARHTLFSGEITNIYMFSMALDGNIVKGLHALGPRYKGNFKFLNEAYHLLNPLQQKLMYDGKLSSSIVLSYNPTCCDRTLILQAAPKGNVSYFVHSQHAQMLMHTASVSTYSIYRTLHSLSGIQVLFPLYDLISLKQIDGTKDFTFCATLVEFFCDLMIHSFSMLYQMLTYKGFMVIGSSLAQLPDEYIDGKILNSFLNLSQYLINLCEQSTSVVTKILKQIMDYILLNPLIWAGTSLQEQTCLYCFISTELVKVVKHFSNQQRVGFIFKLLYILKTYYSAPCEDSKCSNDDDDNDNEHLVGVIRSFILQFVKCLCTSGAGPLDDELNAILNYLHTLDEIHHLKDVLNLFLSLMIENPRFMVPSFDNTLAIRTIFKLIASPSAEIRLLALKILSAFLKRSTKRRKQDAMLPFNLYSLIGDRLCLNIKSLDLTTYAVLFEIMTEHASPQSGDNMEIDQNSDLRIENLLMFRTMSNIIQNSVETHDLIVVKTEFIRSFIDLCKDNSENCRTILQLSVWQNYVLSLIYFDCTNDTGENDDGKTALNELIIELLTVLLFHAVRHELGGWRVWVDTLSILHGKISKFEYEKKAQANELGDNKSETTNHTAESEGDQQHTDVRAQTPFRIQTFKYSALHYRLIDELLKQIEKEFDESLRDIVDLFNKKSNRVFALNIVHLISQTSDSICNCCGGLLPLLASVASISKDIELSACDDEFSSEESIRILFRLANIADVIMLNSSGLFSEIEQEKCMNYGGIVRQMIRLYMTVAVVNCMKCKHEGSSFITATSRKTILPEYDPSKDPMEYLIFFLTETNSFNIQHLELNEIFRTSLRHPKSLLQERDVQRLRNIIYREVDDSKQMRLIILALVYFLSVLMVSRYRDVIENSYDSKFTSRSSISSKSGTSDTQSDISNKNEHEKSDAIKNDIPENKQTDHENDSTEQESDKISRDIAMDSTAALRDFVTSQIEESFVIAAPFLKDIFGEFSHILEKALLGSHGQELLTSGLQCIKLTSVELVMLLCSQEWQTSLQKHAGLAFFELINEGRLHMQAGKDHMMRVANEADFIASRMRAEDISKHTEYHKLCEQTMKERLMKANLCDDMIVANWKRDALMSSKIVEKVLSSVVDEDHGCWTLNTSSLNKYWKLEMWENDLRCRRVMVKNQFGTSHPEAILRTGPIKEENAMDPLTQEVHSALLKRNFFPFENIEEAETSVIEDSETEHHVIGPVQFSTSCLLISPVASFKGVLSICLTEFYFEVDDSDEAVRKMDSKVLQYVDGLHSRWAFTEVIALICRRYMMRNHAIEIFLTNRTTVMFSFSDRQTLNKIVNLLPKVGAGMKYGLPMTRRTSLATPKQLFRSSNMTQRWQRREISNFEYLMFLNTISGRTYQDLNQYPIFPWIISDYESPCIDLDSPNTYRDLSKPIGVINPRRKNFFTERYNNWEHENIPPFHYGTHYSTASFVLNWLIRVEPFTSYFLQLQSGKFDYGNRTFHSVLAAWNNCQNDSSDVKELIPEFFHFPEMFVNSNHYNLGTTDKGEAINDVILPKWAKTPDEFVRINRMALESEFVSCQLHNWIDLIFGYKQRGPEAVRAVNVFYYLTYENSVCLDAIDDPVLRNSIIDQIKSFGQTPSQLLLEPHPPRNSALNVSPLMYAPIPDDVCMILNFPSNAPVIHVTANTHPTLSNPAIITISTKHEFTVNNYHVTASTMESVNLTGVSSVDPIVPSSSIVHRSLGQSFDEKIDSRSENYAVTDDNRCIIATGYWDKSFRVISVETARIMQVIFGHFDIVTCVTYAKASLNGTHCVLTGSKDATVLIWLWNPVKNLIVDKDCLQQDVNPVPFSILTGHEGEINCVAMSGELGLVLSGSIGGLILQHTVSGEIIRSFTNPSNHAIVNHISISREGYILISVDAEKVALFNVNGTLLHSISVTVGSVQSMTFNGDGKFAVIGTNTGIVQILSSFDLSRVYTYPQCDASVRSLAVTHNQKHIVAGLSNGSLLLLNVNFNNLLPHFLTQSK